MSENEFQAGDRVILNPLYATEKTKERILEVVNKIKVNRPFRASVQIADPYGIWGGRAGRGLRVPEGCRFSAQRRRWQVRTN